MRTQVGIIGIGDRGQQLAIAIEKGGHYVSLYHYPETGLDSTMIKLVLANPALNWRAGEDLVDFVMSIETPRLILITDDQAELMLVLDQLFAICTTGDSIVKIGKSLEFAEEYIHLASTRGLNFEHKVSLVSV
jgi:6-phosphogluconate dehydrogenase